jgi:hypothetical protein
MARALALIVLAFAAAARASGPCEEAREKTGLLLAVRDGVLVVAEVTPGSAAAASGVQAGDVVLQANGTVARSCAEWKRTVVDARDGRKALLLLVGRGDGELAMALGRRTWEAPDAPVVAAGPRPTPGVVPSPGPATAPPPPPRPAPPAPEAPPPFPPDVVVSLDSVIADLGALVGKTRAGLASYREAVGQSRRAVETLAVRKAAPAAAVTALRRVARLHEAAVLAWEGMDAIRERDGIAKRLPVSEAMTAPYFSGSPEQSVLDEFEFLQETIDAEPTERRFMESSGEWRPAAARRLAWERAGEELGRLTATVAAPP